MFEFIKRFSAHSWLENPSYSINDGIRNAEALVDRRIGSSIHVDPDAVISHPMIRGGVQLISNLAGSLPLNVMVDGGGSGRATDYANPWQKYLNYSPINQNRVVWMQTLIREAIIFGNAYNLILPDGQLMWLDPRYTDVETNGIDLIYTTTINKIPKRFDASQVIHIKNLSMPSYSFGNTTGQPLHECLFNALAQGLAKYDHVRSYFENGTFSSLVWNLPPKFTQEKAEEFERRANMKYGSFRNAYKNIFLASDATVTPMQGNNATSQMREMMEFDCIVIGNILSLPPDAIGANQNTSYSAQEVNDLRYLRNINHWLIQIEQELTRKLLSIHDVISGKRWIEFNRKGSVEMDAKTEQELLTNLYKSGIVSAEFARRKLNVPIEYITGETYAEPSDVKRIFVHGEAPISTPIADLISDPMSDPEPTEEENSEEDKEAEERSDNRLLKMTENNLKRLVERVAKGNKPAKDHKDIWLETLGIFPMAESKLNELANLIDGATESRSAIAKNINYLQWANELTQETKCN